MIVRPNLENDVLESQERALKYLLSIVYSAVSGLQMLVMRFSTLSMLEELLYESNGK